MFRGDIVTLERHARDERGSGRPLELDGIAVGILDVNRRPCAFRAITPLGWARFDALGVQLSPYCRLVEGIDPDTEMVEIPALRTGWPAALSADLAVHGYDVDQRAAGTQLNESDIVQAPLHRHAEDIGVEGNHRFHALGAQHQMVDFADLNHRVSIISRP